MPEQIELVRNHYQAGIPDHDALIANVSAALDGKREARLLRNGWRALTSSMWAALARPRKWLDALV